MGRYGLLLTHSPILCNERGEQFSCASLNDANRLRLSIGTDCDAYEARIAELEAERDRLAEWHKEATSALLARSAELARVKAESLRVVPVGEALSVDFIPVGLRISLPDRTGIYRRVGSGASAIPEPHSFVILEDCNSGEEINVPYGTQGYPVRLERWEDEDANLHMPASESETHHV